MSKLLLIISLVGFTFAAHSEQFYVIKKVNTGTKFLKPGQNLAGFLDNSAVCGAKGSGIGAQACAVVSAGPLMIAQPLYKLKEVLVTGTPKPNFVGFIKGSIKKGHGIGGDKAMGVFKK